METYCALIDRSRISFHAAQKQSASHNGRQSLTGLIMICTIAGEWLSQFSSHEPWLYYIQSLKFETVVLKWVILIVEVPNTGTLLCHWKGENSVPCPRIYYMQNNGALNTHTLCQVIGCWILTPCWIVGWRMFQRNILPPFSGWQNYMRIQQRWHNSRLCSVSQLQPVVWSIPAAFWSLSNFAASVRSLAVHSPAFFGSTYHCEETFSQLKTNQDT